MNQHRRSIRLEGFDYRTSCGYFITIAAYRHDNLFGLRRGEEVDLNPFGLLVANHWERLPETYPVILGDWIIMPDHMHAILVIDRQDELPLDPPAKTAQTIVSGSLSAIVSYFKTTTARKINLLRRTPGQSVWQRNYHEHIIRDTENMDQLRRYILENPTHHLIDTMTDS
jgi:putative transposase